MMRRINVVRFIFAAVLTFFSLTNQPCASQTAAKLLDQDEVTLLKIIARSLGKNDWDFTVDPCSGNKSGWITDPLLAVHVVYINHVRCSCPENETICHVKSIELKGQSLAGFLPVELARLPFLELLDLSRNCLNGTIPEEWGLMKKVVTLLLMTNRLSGSIPTELGNIITLQKLNLEGNMFSGEVPPELGNLSNLSMLVLAANDLKGELPTTFGDLTNMRDFRISSNNFTGKIPDYIFTRWKNLEKLRIQGTLMEGPFPKGINSSEKLTELIISDLSGTDLVFPQLNGLTNLRRLMIRNCMLSGKIPSYIGDLSYLIILDLSYNNLTGEIPSSLGSLSFLGFLFLTSNNLTGPMPDWFLTRVRKPFLDISYNNFTNMTLTSSTDCKESTMNLVESMSKDLNYSSSISGYLRKDFPCENNKLEYSSLHINCGSNKTAVVGNTIYEADGSSGGPTFLFRSNIQNWACSSTGVFADVYDSIGDYIARNSSILSMPNQELYETARLSPSSLKYYGLCLRNGPYTIVLHFAEIVITDDKNYTSLGRRIFDIYIQGKLVEKDFNIKTAANGSSNEPVTRTYHANVTANTLEIHLFWAGKGTTAIPYFGVYGPLISAISIESDIKDEEAIKKRRMLLAISIGIPSFVFPTLLILTVLWKKGCFISKLEKELRGQVLQIGSFSLRQIKSATNNFDPSNKIGEGGFGPVYKGRLSDGTLIAVKKLSSKSRQGNREFITEIGMISALQHPNLVKLYGCCIEGYQLHLVYEYMENNSLARALFGRENERLKLDWPTRRQICIGIAKGLAYLHEESLLKIVHRDIKSTNILLDKNLKAKISDFGLAKLEEEEHTHISTRIAGTIGYMAPEYAMHGYLTYKADIYSYGVVTLEIVSGKSNTNYEFGDDCFFLLDRACLLQERGNLLDIVDPELGSDYSKEEVLTVLQVALLCTNSSPSLRPTMSTAVSMLEGKSKVHSPIQSLELLSEDQDERTSFLHRRHSNDFSGRLWAGSSKSATDNEFTGKLGNSSKDLYPVSWRQNT